MVEHDCLILLGNKLCFGDSIQICQYVSDQGVDGRSTVSLTMEVWDHCPEYHSNYSCVRADQIAAVRRLQWDSFVGRWTAAARAVEMEVSEVEGDGDLETSLKLLAFLHGFPNDHRRNELFSLHVLIPRDGRDGYPSGQTEVSERSSGNESVVLRVDDIEVARGSLKKERNFDARSNVPSDLRCHHRSEVDQEGHSHHQTVP